MPKLGMEPIRRSALVNAAISEIGREGSLDVTVAQIAQAAGVSSALAHHYFGSKEQILLAAMREILVVFGEGARAELAQARTPEMRLRAIIRACFSSPNFKPAVAQAWLNFYVLAHKSEDAARLLSIYHRRLHSNLVYALRPLVGDGADRIAIATAALIDGIYLRSVLPEPNMSTYDVEDSLMKFLTLSIETPE